MSIYKDYFNGINPEKDNKNFADSIINAEKQKMKIRPKKITAVAVAAATAAAVTVTGYASGWDYGDIFEQIFGEKAINIENHTLEQGTVIENSIDNLDITLTAAAADNHSAIFILDVITEDGSEICYKEGDSRGEDIFWDKYTIRLQSPDPEITYYGMGWFHDVIECNGNKASVAIYTSTEINLLDKELKIRVHETTNPDNQWSIIINMNTEVDEVVYNDLPECKIEVMDRNDLEEFVRLQTTGNYEKKYMSAKIDKLTISPLSLYMTGEFPVDMFLDFDTSYLITKDDQYINFIGGGSVGDNPVGAEYYDGYYISLREPINPEDITAVVISNTVIELK